MSDDVYAPDVNELMQIGRWFRDAQYDKSGDNLALCLNPAFSFCRI